MCLAFYSDFQPQMKLETPGCKLKLKAVKICLERKTSFIKITAFCVSCWQCISRKSINCYMVEMLWRKPRDFFAAIFFYLLAAWPGKKKKEAAWDEIDKAVCTVLPSWALQGPCT